MDVFNSMDNKMKDNLNKLEKIIMYTKQVSTQFTRL